MSEEKKEPTPATGTEAAPAGTPAPAKPLEKIPQDKLEKMTAVKLKEVALQVPGLSGVHAMKKEELLALLREYWGYVEKTKVKNNAALKARVKELRQVREEARQAKDKKKVGILRKKMKQLKRKTRRA